MIEITEKEVKEVLDFLASRNGAINPYILLSSIINRFFVMEKALKEIKEVLPTNPYIWEIKLIVDNALTGKGE